MKICLKVGVVDMEGLGANGLVTITTELPRIQTLCLHHVAHGLKYSYTIFREWTLRFRILLCIP
jgi:hypothetical protein